MRQTGIFHFLSVALFLSLALTSVAGAKGEDGKMPITTSSEKARELFHEGQRFLDRAQPESARPLFMEAVKLDPNFIMAYDCLRRCAPTIRASRDYLVKVRQLTEQVTMSDGEKLFFESLFAAIEGDRQQQGRKLKILAEKYPNDERLLYQYGLFYFGNNDQETVRILGQAEKINPEFVPLYNIKGYSLKALGQFGEAEKAFKRAIELDPQNPNAYDSYGELLLKLGRFEESIESYDEALALEKLFPSAQIGVASNLLLMNKHETARARLNSLLKIAPHDGIRSGIYWALAVTYVDEGKMENALRELKNNLALSSKNKDSGAMAIDFRNMTAILIEMGDYEQALRKNQAALEAIENDPEQNDRARAFTRVFAYYGEGVVAARTKRFSVARSQVQKMEKVLVSLNTPPFFMRRLHELKGIIALEQEQYDTALAEFEQADPTEAYNMYRMAIAFEGKGDQQQSRELLNQVIKYNSALNLNYSFVRHKAAAKLKDIKR